MKTKSFIIGCIIYLIVMGFQYRNGISPPSFTVMDHIWSTKIDKKRQPLDTLNIDSTRGKYPIWLVVKLRGKRNELELLKGKKCDVLFKWFRVSQYGLTPDSSTKQLDYFSQEEISFKLIRLEEALDQQGYFEITLVSGSNQLKRKGVYVVKLVYANNRYLRCGSTPCEYRITIS